MMNAQSSNATAATGEQQRRAKFELGVSLILHSWPALSLAVQNQWGGPDSSGKRDWFAGAICELFPLDAGLQTVDVQDVEDRLMQIMEDEFEVVPDDDSVSPIADAVMEIWTETQSGDFARVGRMFERWRKEGSGKVVAQQGSQSGDSVDEESDYEEDEDEEMGDAPAPEAKKKVAPQVDEDGFQTVTGKRRR